MVTRIKSIINDFHRYRAGLVRRYTGYTAWPGDGAYYVVCQGDELAFAHVLNVPTSEEVWPGDAAELFFREYFAVRLVGDDFEYRKQGPIWEHMRCELMRLCDFPECITLETLWIAQHQVDCYKFNGSFSNELFGKDSSQSQPDETNWDAEPFGSEDDDEPGTLDSELLLTEEYLEPVPSKEGLTSDSVSSSSFADPSSDGPKCRAETNQPTEQEE